MVRDVETLVERLEQAKRDESALRAQLTVNRGVQEGLREELARELIASGAHECLRVDWAKLLARFGISRGGEEKVRRIR